MLQFGNIGEKRTSDFCDGHLTGRCYPHEVRLIIISFVFCSYMFDEPSSYLDVKQRLKCAVTIRDLLNDDRYNQFDWQCVKLIS